MTMYSYSVYNQFAGVAGTDPNAPMVEGLLNPTGTKYSAMWSGLNHDGYGLHVQTTGTLTGAFTLWVSDKKAPSEADDSDWVQDTAFVPVNPAGSTTKFRDDTGNAKGMHKRLKYVHTSGAGTIFAYVSIPES